MVLSYFTTFVMNYYIIAYFHFYVSCGEPNLWKWEFFPLWISLYFTVCDGKGPERSEVAITCTLGLSQCVFIANVMNIIYLNSEWISPQFPRFFVALYGAYSSIRRYNGRSMLIPNFPFKVNKTEFLMISLFFGALLTFAVCFLEYTIFNMKLHLYAYLLTVEWLIWKSADEFRLIIVPPIDGSIESLKYINFRVHVNKN